MLSLAQRFEMVRQHTVALSQPLSEADMTIQAAEFASPGKWHLAHTSWFFEEFLLAPTGWSWPQSAAYRYLFNSYYETVGSRQVQARRGLITRPGMQQVLDYRHKIDAAVNALLASDISPAQAEIIELGIQHEQQHQELFLTDILYNLAQNPLNPAYDENWAPVANPAASTRMLDFDGGLQLVGHNGEGFGFDNEFPRHKVYLEPFRLDERLVTNAEWLDFMADGGYRQPLLWLADGWKTLQAEAWQNPLYWIAEEDGYQTMTLAGLRPLDPLAPVRHISYFEADAYARWRGLRLPTEAEWELAANSGLPLLQLYDSAWQWTSSPYIPYPGFRAKPGAVGEYNGKFMNGQYVLRGGSCVSPPGHLRPSYRNFFYPHQRWQFTGLRLAADGE